MIIAGIFVDRRLLRDLLRPLHVVPAPPQAVTLTPATPTMTTTNLKSGVLAHRCDGRRHLPGRSRQQQPPAMRLSKPHVGSSPSPIPIGDSAPWPRPRSQPGLAPATGPGHSARARPRTSAWLRLSLMGSIRLGFVSGAYWVGSTAPSPTRPLFSELGHHPAAPLTCQCATVASAAGAAASYWRPS